MATDTGAFALGLLLESAAKTVFENEQNLWNAVIVWFSPALIG